MHRKMQKETMKMTSESMRQPNTSGTAMFVQTHVWRMPLVGACTYASGIVLPSPKKAQRERPSVHFSAADSLASTVHTPDSNPHSYSVRRVHLLVHCRFGCTCALCSLPRHRMHWCARPHPGTAPERALVKSARVCKLLDALCADP